MLRERLIYSLCCPFTKEVHYIGKTVEGMRRPLQHLKESHSAKIREWVGSLKELGYAPEVVILETVDELSDIDGRERHWIQYYANKGSVLLNSVLVVPTMVDKPLDEFYTDDATFIEKLSEFVKVKRKQVNLTQEEFADKTGVALTVVRKIEQGKTNVNLNGLLHILAMFGSTLDITRMKR